MKFVTSFSGGKDSMLALDEAIRLGHEPLGLITMVSEETSLFQRIPLDLIKEQAEALGLPIQLVQPGEDYEASFEGALKNWKDKGAEACVFGDMDIEGHKLWDESRCEAVGITACLPLWQWPRQKAVDEFIQRGYRARISLLKSDEMPDEFLGLDLCHALIRQLMNSGIDPCGEGGEFHTTVYDGPIFRRKLDLPAGLRRQAGNVVWLDYGA